MSIGEEVKSEIHFTTFSSFSSDDDAIFSRCQFRVKFALSSSRVDMLQLRFIGLFLCFSFTNQPKRERFHIAVVRAPPKKNFLFNIFPSVEIKAEALAIRSQSVSRANERLLLSASLPR